MNWMVKKSLQERLSISFISRGTVKKGTSAWSWLRDSAEPNRKRGKQTGSSLAFLKKIKETKDILLVLDWPQERPVDSKKRANASRFIWPCRSDKKSCCCALTNRMPVTGREKVCLGLTGSTDPDKVPLAFLVTFHAFWLVSFPSSFWTVLVKNKRSRSFSYWYPIESHVVMLSWSRRFMPFKYVRDILFLSLIRRFSKQDSLGICSAACFFGLRNRHGWKGRVEKEKRVASWDRAIE